MNSCRLLIGLAAAASLAVLTASPLFAHGGVVRPPPAKDPGQQNPGDVPVHGDPGTGGPPIATPGGGPIRPTTPGSRRTRHRADGTVPEPLGPQEDWAFWWSLQQEALVAPPLRGGHMRNATEAADPAASAARRRLRIARTRVVPALLVLVDPSAKEPDDVVASALLALGRLSVESATRKAVTMWLLREDAPPIIRESAALALGMLRRTDPDLRAPAGAIDMTRALLLQVFDGRMGSKRLRVPTRTRIFALYALGLLGDQPFGEGDLVTEGRLVSRLLWERLGRGYRERELRMAPLAALGLQPAAGLPSGVGDELGKLVAGSKALKRSWDPRERSHALTTLVRVGGPRGRASLIRTLMTKKTPLAVRLSGLLAILDGARTWSRGERAALRRVLVGRLDHEDAAGFERALCWMGVAATLDADAREGVWRGFADTSLLRRFETACKTDTQSLGGWVQLAWGIASRGAGDDEAAQAFAGRARLLLTDTLRSSARDLEVRGAAAISLSMVAREQGASALAALLHQPKTPARLREHVATATGLLPGRDPARIEALLRAFRASREPAVRRAIGQALGRQGDRRAADLLVAAMRAGDADTAMRAAMARALGELSDMDAVDPLLNTALGARDDGAGETEEVRAMAIVALGRLLDPEPRPSLLRLLIPANYPVRGDALQEALTLR